MGMFTLVVFFCQGIGPLSSSYTVLNHGWRVSFWWQGAISLASAISMLLFFDETRGPVLLSRRAARMTRESNGIKVFRCAADDERISIPQMIKTSVSRPLIYLSTEPIVISFALWIAMLWATIFMSIGSVSIAFGDAYGWTAQQSSLVLLILSVGGTLGWLLNFWQERLYDRAWKRCNGEPPAEARLHLPSAGAIMVPVGLFW